MSTFNLTPSQTSVPVSAAANDYGRVITTVEMIVDTGQTAISGTSGTIYDCINVPAGYVVLGTGIEVVQADTAGNSGTVTVKVGAASQGSAVTVAATGFTASAGSYTPVVASGSAVFVTLTVGTGTINAIIRVFAVLMDQRAKLGTGVTQGTQTNPAGQTTALVKEQGSYTTALTIVA